MLRLEIGMFSDPRAQIPSESKSRTLQVKIPIAKREGLSLRFEVEGGIDLTYPNVREIKHSGSPRTEGTPRKWDFQF